MDSLVNVVMSLAFTTPVPATPPRRGVVPAVRPSAASALPVPPRTRLEAVPVESTSCPPLMVDGVEVPVAVSIASSTSCTVCVEPAPMPMVTAVVPEPVMVVWPVEKVMVVPLTVIVELLAITVERSLDEEPAVPTSWVAPVIGATLPAVASLSTVVPVTVLLVKGEVVPTGNGLVAKSLGLRPPAAVREPAADDELAGVFGWVGKFAA